MREPLTGTVARVPAWLAAARSFVRRALPNESQHLFALTVAVGLVCGLVAVAFHLLIRLLEHALIERALGAPGTSWMIWTILSPTAGGLLAGCVLTWIVPGAAGSGIPQVKQAFAAEGGRVAIRDALGKFFVGAMQIGSGASLGREGPTAQICAGAASLLARATSLPPRNMRRLTPVGVAAGIAAAFNAPIAAVTFTIEEIVGDLDQAVLSGVVVAAALAAVIERGILGEHPVFQVDRSYSLDHASSLPLYALLGLAAAAIAVLFTDTLLALRAQFQRMRSLPVWSHPAIGGMVTGILAVVTLRYLGATGVTGGGYETLGHALAGALTVRALAVLCIAKLLATVFSYSSGGAGGIFAPALFIGAMLGGSVGQLDVLLLHHGSQELGAFALVGMGAVFAGIIRAPITSVLIIFEMTGGYGLVLPLMLANMTAYVVARKLRPLPIYEALLEQDGVHLPRPAASVPGIERLTVAQAMTREVVSARIAQSAGAIAALARGRTFAVIPVLDEDRRVHGVLTRADLCSAPPDASVASMMTAVHTIESTASLLIAAVYLEERDVHQLVVVDSDARLVGIITVGDVLRAHLKAARDLQVKSALGVPAR